MANNDRGQFLKAIVGGVGILLAVIGYFLVTRDEEVRKTTTALWEQVAGLKAKDATISTDIERLIQNERWLVDQTKDEEQRIRILEHERGK